MTVIRRSVVLTLPLLLGACYYMPVQPWIEAAEVYCTSENAYPPLSDDAPVRLTTGDLEVAYEEVALVVVWPPWNRDRRRGTFEQINLNLERQARALGADAVIRIDYDLQGSETRAPYATGTAVRLLDVSER